MKIRMHAAATICAALVALAAADLAAQTPAESPGSRSAGTRVVRVARVQADQPPDTDRQFQFSRPIVRVGQDYSVRTGDVVREIHTVFGSVTVEGRVEGDVVVVLGSARVASTAVIEGSLVVVGGGATVDEGASIQRDLVIVGGVLTAPPGFSPEREQVVVGTVGIGNAMQSVVPWLTRGLLWGRLIVPDLRWLWLVVGILFLIYAALNAVFEKPVRACADTLLERPLSAFMLGLLVLVLTIPAIAILAASVIGLAVVPFALCALIAGVLVGKAGVLRAVGRTIVRETEPESRLQSFRSLLIGGAILCLAYMVPVLGVVTWAITVVLGLGAATVAFRAAVRREHPPKVRAAAVPSPQPQRAVVPETAAVGSGAAVPLDAPAPPNAPAPVPAGPPGGDFALYPRATFLDRVAAFALDCILVAIAVQLLDLSRHDGSFPLLLLVYHIAFWAWKGTTLGGIVVGLRVVRTQGTELRFADALVRGLSSVFSIAALGIGCFWMLQDPERQMWHDKIAGTLVVKVPRHMVLP
jgi:uncharacterized RDD family membrane protein YckC